MKYAKGWSSRRGQATHLVPAWAVGVKGGFALCLSPIRIFSVSGHPPAEFKRLRGLEICDHCQRVQRARAAEGRRKA